MTSPEAQRRDQLSCENNLFFEARIEHESQWPRSNLRDLTRDLQPLGHFHGKDNKHYAYLMIFEGWSLISGDIRIQWWLLDTLGRQVQVTFA
jgi:hypothetical protein